MVIYDEDEVYASNLAQYFLEKENFLFNIWHFSKMSYLQQFNQNQHIDLLLISDNFINETNILQSENEKGKKSTIFFYLTKEKEKVKTNKQFIFKYQSAEEILRHILSNCEEEDFIEKKETDIKSKIIGVYSPVGRSFQTTFSLLIGQILSKDQSTLYLNFEGCSGFNNLFHKHFSYHLSDLVYYIVNSKEKLILRMQNMIEKLNQLDYIPPVTTIQELTSVSGKQWMELLHHLSTQSGYEYIILDLTDQVQGLFDILRSCTTIYTISQQDSFAIAKQIQYEEMLRLLEYEDVIHKTKTCQIPHIQNIPTNLERLPYCELAGFVKQMIKDL